MRLLLSCRQAGALQACCRCFTSGGTYGSSLGSRLLSRLPSSAAALPRTFPGSNGPIGSPSSHQSLVSGTLLSSPLTNNCATTTLITSSSSSSRQSVRASSTLKDSAKKASSEGKKKGERLHLALDDVKGDGHEDIMKQLDAIAQLLDTNLSIPGTRFKLGLGTSLGRIPVAGGLAYGAVGVYTLAVAMRYGASPWLLARMGSNVAFSTALRSIPLIGSLSNSAAESSRKNIQLLQDFMRKQAGAAGKKGAAAVDSSGGGAAGPEWKLPELKWRSLCFLVVGVLLVPLSIGLGLGVFVIYVLLKTLGWWPFILKP